MQRLLILVAALAMASCSTMQGVRQDIDAAFNRPAYAAGKEVATQTRKVWKRIPIGPTALEQRVPELKQALNEIAAMIERQPTNILIAVVSRSAADNDYLQKELNTAFAAHSKGRAGNNISTIMLVESIPEIRLYRESIEFPAKTVFK